MTVGGAVAPGSRSRSGLLRDGGWGVERPAVDAALPTSRVSLLSSPYGTAHRAGPTGRRSRGTRSVLPRSRLSCSTETASSPRMELLPHWFASARVTEGGFRDVRMQGHGRVEVEGVPCNTPASAAGQNPYRP